MKRRKRENIKGAKEMGNSEERIVSERRMLNGKIEQTRIYTVHEKVIQKGMSNVKRQYESFTRKEQSIV